MTSRLISATKLAAVHTGEMLVIIAEGEKPSPGHQVDIEVLKSNPPQYSVVASAVGPVICVMTAYRYAEAFIEPYQPIIKVHTMDGTRDVDVLRISAQSTGDGSVVANLFATAELSRRSNTAVGYSDTFSIEEAFKDAIGNLPPGPAPYPDYLASVKIQEIGALYGGFAGYNGKLFVKVSG